MSMEMSTHDINDSYSSAQNKEEKIQAKQVVAEVPGPSNIRPEGTEGDPTDCCNDSCCVLIP